MSHNKMENNDCICGNNSQPIENNKCSISFIVNDYINTKNTNTAPTTNNNNNNNNSSRDFFDPLTNSNRRCYVINFLNSVCYIRNQPYNIIIHRNAIEKICDCRIFIANEISIYNSLKTKDDLFLNMINLTSFINDCVTELIFLDSFQSSLVIDIQMFSNEIGTRNVPNRKIPTPVLPPLVSDNNSTNLQNQISSQTITSQSPHINNNNTITDANLFPRKRRLNVNNYIVKETMELSKKLRTTNQTSDDYNTPKIIRKLKLRPGDCYMCPNIESNNWRNFIFNGQHITLCNACGLRMIKINKKEKEIQNSMFTTR